nr:MAG TPA: ERF superfamily protein [Caudoviricetes sp.]
MKLLEKLLAIQIELKAPKNQYNSFGKYKYRNCEDILEAVKPLCLKNKAVLTISDEIKNENGRFYVKAIATLHDTESDETILVSAFAREVENKTGMDGSQVTGASSSYARKYALNGLFAIDDTKDSDTTNTGDKGEDKLKSVQETKPQKANKQILSEVEKQLKELAEEHGYELEDIRISCQEYFKKSINELTDEELAKIIKAYSK